MINDGGSAYRMQVMTAGCGASANGCGGQLTGWSESYNQYGDAANCMALGNCSDGFGRITTVVIRVFRIAGSTGVCTNYTVRATL